MIGGALCRELSRRRHRVRAAVRRTGTDLRSYDIEVACVGDLGEACDWREALQGVSCVFHCAARAHVLRETDPDPLHAYRRVNVQGTQRLAEAAAESGVRRMVFVSSIGVLGTATKGEEAFSESSPPRPEEDYARTKLEAEHALWEVSRRTGLEIVVVRPPLVYGRGAKGNFARLVRLVSSGLPIPFGAVVNRRSLVGVDNLAELLAICGEYPRAAGGTFLVSDGEDLSTPELIRRIAAAMGRTARLVPVPPALLRWGGRLFGRAAEVERLLGSLRVDMGHTCQTLAWRPKVGVNEGLARALAAAEVPAR